MLEVIKDFRIHVVLQAEHVLFIFSTELFFLFHFMCNSNVTVRTHSTIGYNSNTFYYKIALWNL